MRLLIRLFAIGFIITCSTGYYRWRVPRTNSTSPAIAILLEENASASETELKTNLVGKRISAAKLLLLQNGFTVLNQRDDSRFGLKRKKSLLVTAHWRVQLTVANEKVSDVKVTFGYIGP